MVGYARRNFMTPLPRFASWDAFNGHLEEQCRNRQGNVLRGHRESIGERFVRDREALKRPLPAPFDACDKQGTRVNSLSLVRYRGNDCSVPVAYGHQEVWIRGYVHEVVIGCGAGIIARHPRSYDREDMVFDPIHYLPLLEHKIGALDQAAPLAGWELPDAFPTLRRLLEARMGKAGKREYVQVLRLAVSLNIGRTAVGDYINRARRAGLGWPLAEDLSDEDLERLPFPPPVAVSPDRRSLPDWPVLHRELKRPGVTLSLLWEEYRAVHRDGYGYSRFCELYRAWKGGLAPTMRQSHVAGEKMFVDYAGATLEVIDGLTGEVRAAQIFVATLGASSYTYAEATWTQALPNWIGSHSRAFAYFGGVAAQVVPDNLKSGVVKACLYDPEINRTYAGMAAHYDTAIVPARPRKPRDKAKVEVSVQIVERWVLARLRNRRFFSLAELNQAIHERLEDLNGRETKHLGASRRKLFEALDRPALKPLPAQPYQYAEWKPRRAGLDYHVEIAKHYYSVPHTLAKQKLWARITERTVEIFHKGKRVAAHMRGSGNRRHTTIAEHMPSAHRRYAGWTPARIRSRATAVGANTEILVDVIMRNRPHPEQGFRSCIGILRLAKTYGSERLEAACERALEIDATSYSSVASILKNKLERRAPRQATDGPAIDHPNIRGPQYFH